MNTSKAFDYLEIHLKDIGINELNTQYLKKQYHRTALKYHPDKNGNTHESNERFKLINESYIYLLKEINNIQNDIYSENYFTNNFENNDTNISFLYFNILENFIKNVIDNRYNEIILKILNDILVLGKNISFKLFEDLDREILLIVYNFLFKYKNILYLKDDILIKIKELVIQKYNNNIQIYKLNPSLDDLLKQNIYKLSIDGHDYFVPLWHHEVYFDGSGCEILVISEPEFEITQNNNVSKFYIDNDNNLFVDLYIYFNYIQKLLAEKQQNIELKLGEQLFHIPIKNLYISELQIYKLKNQGLPKIKKDIYDVSEKMDIIVKIFIE